MKKKLDKWKRNYGHNCFACSDDHPFGLRLSFSFDGEEMVSHWKPDKRFQGWPNVVHGGIQCTMLDEISGWIINNKLKIHGVTMSMETLFLRPLLLTDGTVEIRAKILKSNDYTTTVKAWLLNGKGEHCTEAKLTFRTYSQFEALKKFGRQSIKLIFNKWFKLN